MTEEKTEEQRHLPDITKQPITWNTLVSMAQSPTVPERYEGEPFDLFAAILVGRELGIGPMESINELYLVGGKVSMSGRLMSSLVHRKGHILKTRMGPDFATVEAHRLVNGKHELMGEVTFTQEDAERAGLWGSGAWADYPMVMLAWRATTICVRFFFPECLTSVNYEHSEVGIEVEPDALPVESVVVVDRADLSGALDAEGVAEALDGEVIDAEVIDDVVDEPEK